MNNVRAGEEEEKSEKNKKMETENKSEELTVYL
jgi:hypothetical protein